MDIINALGSWTLDLRTQRRSPRTIETYSLAVIPWIRPRDPMASEDSIEWSNLPQ